MDLVIFFDLAGLPGWGSDSNPRSDTSTSWSATSDRSPVSPPGPGLHGPRRDPRRPRRRGGDQGCSARRLERVEARPPEPGSTREALEQVGPGVVPHEQRPPWRPRRDRPCRDGRRGRRGAAGRRLDPVVRTGPTAESAVGASPAMRYAAAGCSRPSRGPPGGTLERLEQGHGEVGSRDRRAGATRSTTATNSPLSVSSRSSAGASVVQSSVVPRTMANSDDVRR